MKCEKTPVLERLAVLDPEALHTGRWSAHLRRCHTCRHTWQELERSLAIFCHVEREARQRFNAEPRWEAFSRRLAARAPRRRGRGVRGPLVAGLTGVLVGGMIGWSQWPVLAPSGPASREDRPARQASAVNPAPAQQASTVSERYLSILNRHRPSTPAPDPAPRTVQPADPAPPADAMTPWRIVSRRAAPRVRYVTAPTSMGGPAPRLLYDMPRRAQPPQLNVIIDRRPVPAGLSEPAGLSTPAGYSP